MLFRSKVIAFDPYLPRAEADRLGVELVDRQDLLRDSDIISLHAPLTPETRELVNAESIAIMKAGVLIVNTARGPLVNIPDLVEGLRSGQVGGAGLDVLPTEPPPADSPLFAMENAILTPHSPLSSREAIIELQTKAAQEVRRALCGEKPVNGVNPAVLEQLTWLPPPC